MIRQPHRSPASIRKHTVAMPTGSDAAGAMRDQAGLNRKDGTMRDSIADEERTPRGSGHLALATEELQCSLPVSDTPLLVEEMLEAEVNWADDQLYRLAQPRIRWCC